MKFNYIYLSKYAYLCVLCIYWPLAGPVNELCLCFFGIAGVRVCYVVFILITENINLLYLYLMFVIKK